MCWQSMVYGGLVGGGLVAMAVCIILLAVYFIKRRGNVSSATVCEFSDYRITMLNMVYCCFTFVLSYHPIYFNSR